MKYTEDMIREAIRKKYKPIVNRGMIAKSKCPECKAIKMIKFSPDGHPRRRVHACVCGYRKGFAEGDSI